jgi:hypothetical protein
MSEKTNLSDRLQSRRAAPVEDDPDASEDCGAFGFLRGVKDRALLLELRLTGGNREAFPYSMLERISYDPSEGLTLRYLGVTVAIRGRNLSAVSAAGVSLLDALLRHRVPWVRETEGMRSAGTAAPEITRISIREG